jgi:hypothetical protein
MTIRLAVVSTADLNTRILERIKTTAGDRIEVVLHVGGADADIKGSSLSRMTRRSGKTGHLFADQRWTGAALRLMERDDFAAGMEQCIDELHRRAENRAYNSHPLRSMQDYVDYYYILADVVGQALIDRGVTHCLFFNVPHMVYDTILYQAATALGLPITIVTQSLFPDRFFSLTACSDYGAFAPDPAAPPLPIEKGEKLDLFYMNGIKQEREAGGRISAKAMLNLAVFLARKRPLAALNPFYLRRLVAHVGRVYGAFPKWRDPFARFFHVDELAYFDHLAGFEDQTVDLSGDYIYMPLQLQPEMTTSALGGRFHDQALAIERLAAILPEGVRILVKENPKQGGYMRGPLFFHRLARIPAVTLLPSWADTHALTARARCVATITGTVGWEAIRLGKPALVFGRAWYRRLPGVIEWRDDLTYADIAGASVDHAALEASAGALLARSHHGVVDRHYAKIVPDYQPDANIERVAATIVDLIEGRAVPTFRETPSCPE